VSREFHYAAVWEDEQAMLTDILAREELVAITAEWYARPTPFTFTKLDERTVDRVRRTKMLYLWSEGYSRHKPQLDKVESDDKDARATYSVNDSTGPMIVWSLSSIPIHLDDRGLLGPGCIYHHTYYYDPSSDSYPNTPLELKAAYKRMVKILRKHLTTIEIKGKRIPIGRAALAELEEGKRRLSGFVVS
jgi:hypothetical protein